MKGHSLWLLARFEAALAAKADLLVERGFCWWAYWDPDLQERAVARSKAMTLRLRNLLAEDGARGVSAIADKLGWSAERVEEVFVGMKPLNAFELIEVSVAVGVRLDSLWERVCGDCAEDSMPVV